MSLSPKDIRQGRERLARLLPDVRKEARKVLTGEMAPLQPKTHLGSSVLQHIKEENLDMLVVYESRPGAWYADLILKNTPVGVPDTLGTPVAHPLPNREEAEAAGTVILTSIVGEIILAEHTVGDMPQADVRVFRLHDIEFSIPMGLITSIADSRAELEAMSDTPIGLNAVLILQAVCIELSGQDVMNEELWAKATDEQKMRAFAAMAMMLTDNQFSHPPATQVEFDA